MREEPVFLGSPNQKLLFPPARITAVRKPNSPDILVEGRDYVPTQKGLRFLTSPEVKSAPSSLSAPSAADKLHIGTEYQDFQYWVTYERSVKGTAGDDNYPYPETCGGLPLNDLLNRPKVRVTIFGDSISEGANASGRYVYPHQPGYAGLIEAYLSVRYPSKWAFRNTSSGGWDTRHAVRAFEYRALDNEADLFILAFGMNDASFSTPKEYEARLSEMVGRIKARYPASYILLVSSLSANPLWDKADSTRFKPFSNIVRTIASQDQKIACADMFNTWSWLTGRKAYLDLTGNGVNHPNDFGYRVQADVVLNAILGAEYQPIDF